MSDIELIKNKEAMQILGYKSHKSLDYLEGRGLLTAHRHPFYNFRSWDKSEVQKVAEERREHPFYGSRKGKGK